MTPCEIRNSNCTTTAFGSALIALLPHPIIRRSRGLCMNISPRDRDAGPRRPGLNPDNSIPRAPSRAARGSLLILTGLWLAIYIAGIFTPPLLDDVDAVHAEAAREML